jgi:DNA-binding FadR family transcriptional regulator
MKNAIATVKPRASWTDLIRRGSARPAGMQSASLHGMILTQIGQRIVRGDFAPGEALPNADDWCAAEGVSRTVLREAIKVLAGKGLVESRPKTGTRVRPRADWNFLDPDVLAWRFASAANGDDARSLFDLRRGIEPMAAGLAAERATPAQVRELEGVLAEMEEAADEPERFAAPDLVFHQSLLRMTGNELIGSLAAVIETALLMSFRLSNDNPSGQRHSMPLHREVVVKIAAKDPEGARQAMLTLLDQAQDDVRRSIDVRRGRLK